MEMITAPLIVDDMEATGAPAIFDGMEVAVSVPSHWLHFRHLPKKGDFET